MRSTGETHPPRQRVAALLACCALVLAFSMALGGCSAKKADASEGSAKQESKVETGTPSAGEATSSVPGVQGTIAKNGTRGTDHGSSAGSVAGKPEAQGKSPRSPGSPAGGSVAPETPGAPAGTPGSSAGSASPANPSKPVPKPAPAPAPSNKITVTLTVDSSAVDTDVSFSKKLTLNKGASVYDALKSSGAVVASGSTPMGVYVSSINSLKEKAYGAESGWQYAVNGPTPGKSCDRYTLSDGDRIKWFYKK